MTEGNRSQNQRGDEGDGIGLEKVGRHTGAVAHVVADVVGNRGGVARIVFGDVFFNLAHEVGADIGGLREDAATDAHEHREQCGTETEAFQHAGGVAAVDQHDCGGADEAEAYCRHTHRTAGPEGYLHRHIAAFIFGRRCYTNVGAGRKPHSRIADCRRKCCAKHEEDGASNSHIGIAGQNEEQREGKQNENGEGLELTGQVGRGALLDRTSDLLHLFGAFTGTQNFAAEHCRHDESEYADRRHNRHKGDVASGQFKATGCR